MSASIQHQLQALNYSFEIIYDQSFHTVKCDDGRKVWYIAEESATHKVVTLEDWKTGERHTLKEGTGSLSPEERAKHAVSIRLAQEQASKVAVSRLSELHYGPSPYLNRKGLHTTLPMLVDQGLTYMPITEASGNVTSFQSISEYGDKTFHVGGKTHGCVGVVKKPHLPPKDVVALLGEGLATVVASYEACALSHPRSLIQPFTVLSAKNYAEAVLRLWEAGYRSFIIVADHDIGLESNPGLLAAKEAESICKELQASCMVVLPEPIDEKSTDMCDVVAARGLSDAAKLFWGAEVLFAGLSEKTGETPQDASPCSLPLKESVNVDGGLSEDVSTHSEASVEVSTHSPSPKPTLPQGDGLRLPPCQYDYRSFSLYNAKKTIQAAQNFIKTIPLPRLPQRRGKNGKLEKIEKQVICNEILKALDKRLVVCGTDFFVYNGLYWQQLHHTGALGSGLGDVSDLIKMINTLSYERYGGSEDMDILNKLRNLAPRVPSHINLFSYNFTKVNFLNGTLHLLQSDSGNCTLSFSPHNPQDYCTNVLPYPYIGDEEIPHPKFTQMLNTLFGNDPERESKIRLVQQIFGDSILPLYPQLILLIGRSGSGKSTILKLIREFLHEDNISSLAPTQLHGFHLESCIGKTLNICGDIPTEANRNFVAETDSVIKQIMDRDLVAINRKNKNVVKGTLPPVHLFAGNDFPQSNEAGSSQMNRRWTFIPFEHSQVPIGHEDLNFARNLLSEEALGILSFALKGVVDLIKNRGFAKLKSQSETIMREWAALSNSTFAFWEEAMTSGVNVGLKKSETENTFEKVVLRFIPGDQKHSLDGPKVYQIYQQWCLDSGFKNPETRIEFSRKTSRKYSCTKRSNGRTVFVGVSFEN